MLQRIGRYELIERVATGGQGTVYRARDTVLDRIVAVKVINQPVAADPQYLEAIQREARLAAGLDHPNITRILPVLTFMIAMVACAGGGPSDAAIDATVEARAKELVAAQATTIPPRPTSQVTKGLASPIAASFKERLY